MGIVATTCPVGESNRTSTVPGRSAYAAAIRIVVVTEPAVPRSTPSYRIQSPLDSQPTFWPPPTSAVGSVQAPDCALKDAALIVPSPAKSCADAATVATVTAAPTTTATAPPTAISPSFDG